MLPRVTSSRHESGQAVAEFAAVIPILVLFIFLLVEIGVLLLDQLALQQVAREAARTAAVSSSEAEINQAGLDASDLDPRRLKIELGPRPDSSGLVKVNVQYEARIVEPFTGSILFRPQLQAKAAMRVEGATG